MVMYSTDMMMAGQGTGMDGMLMPGMTYTVFLSEILMAAGHEGPFLGYAWIVGNFDGIAGTRKVVDNMDRYVQRRAATCRRVSIITAVASRP